MKKFTFLLLFLSCTGFLGAQATDVLHLRSGTVVPGTLVRYSPEESVVSFKRAEDNITRSYPLEAIEQIQQLPAAIVEAEAWQIVLPLAQRKKVTSQVTLGDGTIREGTIIDYSDQGVVSLRMKSGTLLMVDATEIQEITYDMPRPKRGSEYLGEDRTLDRPAFTKEPAVYEFRENGWFNMTSFAFSFGKRERDQSPFFGPDLTGGQVSQSAVGFNVQHVTGYQFSRMLGLGAGVSYDAYDLEDGESILTVFAHYRGYLTKTIVAPYIGINGGYGFALKNKKQGVITAEGGWMLHPELGVRLGATDKANFTLALGYRLQDAYYVQERPFNGNIEYRNITYQRFLFSLGLLF